MNSCRVSSKVCYPCRTQRCESGETWAECARLGERLCLSEKKRELIGTSYGAAETEKSSVCLGGLFTLRVDILHKPGDKVKGKLMHKCYHNNFLPHAFCDGVFNMGTLSKQFSEKAIVQRNRLSLLSYGKILYLITIF